METYQVSENLIGLDRNFTTKTKTRKVFKDFAGLEKATCNYL